MRTRDLDPADCVDGVEVRTRLPALIVIVNKEPFLRAAERGHWVSYKSAVVLFENNLIETDSYRKESAWVFDSRVTCLPSKSMTREDEQFTTEYHNLDIESATNDINLAQRWDVDPRSRSTLSDGATKREQYGNGIAYKFTIN